MNSSTMSIRNKNSSEARHLTEVGKFWIAYLFFILCLTVSLLNLIIAASYRDTLRSFISGCLVLLAAFLIWRMRKDCRHEGVGNGTASSR
jgi:glucan phosphoethanolaminetransferase (alkaline phosphatase superfamily)